MVTKKVRSRRKDDAAGGAANKCEGSTLITHPEQGGASVELAAGATPSASRPTKASLVQRMLAAPGGATMAALVEATGWQPHTLRAALTRLRQAGHAVERERTEAGETVYRIAVTPAGEADPAVQCEEAAS